VNLHQLIDRFDPVTVPRHPVTFTDLAAR
jgi:hypothetical protein